MALPYCKQNHINADFSRNLAERTQISKTGVKEVKPPDSISLKKTSQQLPLPPLAPEGNLMALAELLKLPMKSFYQILMFLVSILIGCARVILVITGCPGSGKSTLAALAKALLDPENSSLTSLPGKLSDLKLVVSKSRVLVLDNITNFDNRFADTLCMVVTGGSTKQRTLYTTDDTTVNEFTSSIIMTALHKPTERADLIERMIFVECPKLKEPISEKELHAKFEEAKPAILRGLYDLVHEGYKNEDYKPVKTANRMQDLIHFMGRLEKTLGLEYGFFAKFSDELNKELKEDIAENSILAITLAKVLKNAAASSNKPHEFRLKKKNSEILNLLHSYAPKNAFKDPEFPKTSASLGRKLSELSTVLKTLGIAFERQNSTKDGGRTIEFYFTNKQKKRMLKRQETQPKKKSTLDELLEPDEAF